MLILLGWVALPLIYAFQAHATLAEREAHEQARTRAYVAEMIHNLFADDRMSSAD
jgi:hypothetical protein